MVLENHYRHPRGHPTAFAPGDPGAAAPSKRLHRQNSHSCLGSGISKRDLPMQMKHLYVFNRRASLNLRFGHVPKSQQTWQLILTFQSRTASSVISPQQILALRIKGRSYSHFIVMHNKESKTHCTTGKLTGIPIRLAFKINIVEEKPPEIS